MPFSCFFFPFAIDIAIERQLFAAISFMPLFSPYWLSWLMPFSLSH
jgi:hypothetical protein